MARNFGYDSRINKIAGVIRNMSKGKLLIVGILFGVLAIFAFIGVKSMMSDRKLVTQDTGYTPILPEGSSSAGSSSGVVGAGTDLNTGTLPSASSPATEPNLTTQDRPLPDNTANPADTISLEGEPQDATTNSTNPNLLAGQINAGTAPSATDTGTTATTNTTNPSTTPSTTTTTNTNAGTDTNLQATAPVSTGFTEPVQGSMGKLGLTIFDSLNPSAALTGEFLVYDTEGVQVASFSGSDTTSFSLPSGKYLVKVKSNGKEASRLLEVYADKLTNARFEMPSSAMANTTTSGTQTTSTNVPAATNTNGQVYITVRAAENNRNLRSNIYVQKQNGQHVAKSNYAEGAEFSLEPGAYKVTVKVEGRQDVVRTIRVSANGIVRETIMISPAGNAAPPQPVPQPTQPVTSSPIQTNPATVAVQQEGLLRLRLNTGQGLPEQARFVIRNKQGERVATVGPAPNGEINLPAGTYEITAGIQGLRQSRMIEVGNGRVSELAFEAAEIIGQEPVPAVSVPPQVTPVQNGQPPTPAPAQQAGGRLHLYAISGVDRQPLRVNFTVMTLQGQPIQSFHNVSSAELRVPPQSVQVRINYQSMNGTEVINVLPDQPTEYTFTISPTN